MFFQYFDTAQKNQFLQVVNLEVSDFGYWSRSMVYIGEAIEFRFLTIIPLLPRKEWMRIHLSRLHRTSSSSAIPSMQRRLRECLL